MTEQAPTLCIHHAPCADGFTAAWVVWKRFGSKVRFHPGVHGQAPPDVTGEHVVIVDFSYPQDVLLEITKTAASVLVLDHHKTAREELKNFPAALATWEGHMRDVAQHPQGSGLNRIGVQFDMGRSGAMMTWDYFNPESKDAPVFIEHVQDRDLWLFKIAGTREIQSWVFSFPYDFALWDEMVDQLETIAGWNKAFEQGEAITRKHLKDIAEIIDGTRRVMTIGGHAVPVANMPWTMASEAAGLMAEADKSIPFAAVYFDAADGTRVFSLRSRGDFDVGVLAKEMGKRFCTSGGGHAAAAGFRALPGWEGEDPWSWRKEAS